MLSLLKIPGRYVRLCWLCVWRDGDRVVMIMITVMAAVSEILMGFSFFFLSFYSSSMQGKT